MSTKKNTEKKNIKNRKSIKKNYVKSKGFMKKHSKRYLRKIRNTRKRRNNNSKKKQHLMRGGEKPSFLNPEPIAEQGLSNGATTPQEQAYLEQQQMYQEQNAITNGEVPPSSNQNGQTGGGNGEITVPQTDTPISGETNNLIAELTKTSTQAGANSVMDGCAGAGASCTNANAWDGKGGYKKKNKRNTKKMNKRKKSMKQKKNTKKMNKNKNKNYK